ncbi:hypothetical protein IFM89_016630 [Coptis chinensis]|uniref:Uncharacterized protein n=1 Tax=Coptis chinensis TaxID=261450 RepID=A0A835IND9_9MAGN|nr:hypothetical protein IFM89_016630 [Coptis chinensis]
MAAVVEPLPSKNWPLLFYVRFVLVLLLWSATVKLAYAVSCDVFTVRYLPGFEGPLPFHLETGYVGVGEKDDLQLFYYFVHSERNPTEDPLVLWLSGGPRCSSLSGLAYEIGPIYFRAAEGNGNRPTLALNPYSWTKAANIIFLDAPVGTGFSYSKTGKGLNMSDTKSAGDTYQFLMKWLMDHPEFLSNPLYICGDSYSGIIIPIIVQEVLNGIAAPASKEHLFNFKGYLIGNPLTDRHLETNAQVSFAHGMGLISDELHESLKRTCKGEYVNVDSTNIECLKDCGAFSKCISGVNKEQILEPLCYTVTPKQEISTHSRRSLMSIRGFLSSESLRPTTCRIYNYMLSEYWANDDEVRNALKIRKGTVEEWIRCNQYRLPYESDVKTSIDYHLSINTRGYRSLIYSGDHDMMVSHVSTEAWIRLINSSIIDDWHPWEGGTQLQSTSLRNVLQCFRVLRAATTAVSSGYTVRSLPGVEGPLPFHLGTGYVGVDERDDKQS